MNFTLIAYLEAQLCMLQFTQILDILQVILRQRDIKHLMLTGSTPVDVRQSLVDEFTEDDSIKVFLLSTKAGGNYICSSVYDTLLIDYFVGMGINLTAASVVIMSVILLRLSKPSDAFHPGLTKTSTRITIDKHRTAPTE